MSPTNAPSTAVETGCGELGEVGVVAFACSCATVTTLLNASRRAASVES